MHLGALVALASCATAVDAHVALWNKGMFGYNYPRQANDKTQNYNNNDPVNPLRQSDALTVSQWFGHGYKSFPPVSGDFMDLPSGGTYNGEIQCNRAQTTMGDPYNTAAKPQYACDNEGALHTTNRFGQSLNVARFGGTAIGIAYTSDVNAVKPNDMTIISVNYASPWTRQIGYRIPAGMPPCPSGGCICSWNWVHRAGNGEGYRDEIYNLLYRCRITGTTNSANVVQRGAVPKDCTNNASACVKGPKTGLYIYQRDGNNLPPLDVPPSYSAQWGFADGAQNDIFTKSANPAGDANLINPYATGSGTQTFTDPDPTSTAIPSGWKSVGCTVDSNTRYLTTQAYSLDTNTITMCVNWCNQSGFSAAGLQGGKECWCGNPTKSPTMAPASECDYRCPGDIFAICGGPWRSSLYTKAASVVTTTATARATTTTAQATTTAAAAPTSSIPSGWKYLGCHSEKSGSRMFSADFTESRSMTAAFCISYCSGKGYKYAGTQYMTQCYCGNTFVPNETTGCDSVCAGDKTQKCGGAYKNSVYAVSSVTKREQGMAEKILEWVPSQAASLFKRSADEAQGAVEKILEWIPYRAQEPGILATEAPVKRAEEQPEANIAKRSGEIEPIEEWIPTWRLVKEDKKDTPMERAEIARMRRRHLARPHGRDLDRRF